MDTTTKKTDDSQEDAITLDEYTGLLEEIESQPKWRYAADREMDYADGKQLDSDLLRKQQERGIPPAIEDLIGPSLLSIQGFEAATRTDWRVTPDGDPSGKDAADAISYKLNQAERHSGADRACSKAFRPQIAVGLGWVEVARNSNPFEYPYKCTPIHRNEIDFDFKAEDPIKDGRFLRRQRWLMPERIAMAFPEHKAHILACGRDGSSWWMDERIVGDESGGGMTTGLMTYTGEAPAWTVAEDRWYNPESKELCLAEFWYRRWVSVPVLMLDTGRAVEFDANNPVHTTALMMGRGKLTKAVVGRARRSYWLGPIKLHDGRSPYPHELFPYVPFIGFREDSTLVPYGYCRGMMYQQDAVNSGTAKLRWGMGAVRVERTEGVYIGTDAKLRKEIARPDADVVLSAEKLAQPGARFDVKRDYTLTDQHFQMLQDSRAAIERVSTVTAGFQGRQGTARSGLQEQTQVEQSNQSLQTMMDNFRHSRTQVGEMLMALIVEDIGRKQQAVVIEGDAIRPERTVMLNTPEVDQVTGDTYLSNDMQRIRLKVALEDVPSTPSFRGQQLNSMSEAVKALPAQFQAAAMPFLASLMDVPFKTELVEALRAAGGQETPEQVEQRIKQTVQDALAKAGNDLKARELDMKERLTEAQVKNIMAQAVQTGVQAAFSAMQGGAQIAQMPMIAPIADAIMQGAGYQRPTPGGDDPNFPVPTQTAAMSIRSPYTQGQGAEVPMDQPMDQPVDAPDVRQNTSPAFPPVPQEAGTGMQGIETPATFDNIEEPAQ